MKGLLRHLFPARRHPTTAVERPAGDRFMDAIDPPERVSRPRGVRIDGNTRTFWERGEESATTIVDVETPYEIDGHRVAGMRGRRDARPRGNPAFSETLFVELMRAGQFPRAYEHISPECQGLWGSVEAFAAAQSTSALRAVQGVTVRDVRYLDAWTDPNTDVAHRNVAELRVDYNVGTGPRGGEGAVTRLERTVHWVPIEGRWRSLCAPTRSATEGRRAG